MYVEIPTEGGRGGSLAAFLRRIGDALGLERNEPILRLVRTNGDEVARVDEVRHNIPAPPAVPLTSFAGGALPNTQVCMGDELIACTSTTSQSDGLPRNVEPIGSLESLVRIGPLRGDAAEQHADFVNDLRGKYGGWRRVRGDGASARE